MTNPDSDAFRKTVDRAAKGKFREYWLQRYIKDNYEKLGLHDLEGPFDKGYDFRGTYKGRKVIIEAETESRNFILHRHKADEVDILITLSDSYDRDVLGMKLDEWRQRLPPIIMAVDPEDFVKATHEERKAYALKKEQDTETFMRLWPFLRIKDAFSKLWTIIVGEIYSEGTPEAEHFEDALIDTALTYIGTYKIDLDMIRKEESVFTQMEILANDLVKSRRDFEQFSDEEKEHVNEWLGVLQDEFSLRL